MKMTERKEFFEEYVKNQHCPDKHEQFIKWFECISPCEAEQIMDEFLGLAQLLTAAEARVKNDALTERLEARLDELDNENATNSSGDLNTKF